VAKKRKPETLEKRVEKLESLVGILKECIDHLNSGCACSVKERLGGHRLECSAPFITDLAEELEKVALSEGETTRE
jgi:hypothetical protein